MADSILFYLSDGDLSKLPALRKSRIKYVYDFYYLRRVQALNKVLEEVEQGKSSKYKVE